MHASPDDIVGMIFFARVVEAKSFSAAAEKLGVAKSAVSARIAKLEGQLGVRLLNRTTRQIALTEDGLHLYEHCAKLVTDADEALEIVAGTGKSPRGTLRISAPGEFSTYYLAKPLSRFLAAHPDVRVDLRLSDRFVDIVNEGIDIAIRITWALPDSSLIARKISSDRGVVCASPAYLAKHGTPTRPEDLIEHSCMRYSLVRNSDHWVFKKDGHITRVPVSGSIVADSGSFMREAAIEGHGLVVLPTFIVAGALANGSLVTVLDEYDLGELNIYAVHAHKNVVPAKVRAFIEHLVKEWANPPWRAPKETPAPKASAAKRRTAS